MMKKILVLGIFGLFLSGNLAFGQTETEEIDPCQEEKTKVETECPTVVTVDSTECKAARSALETCSKLKLKLDPEFGALSNPLPIQPSITNQEAFELEFSVCDGEDFYDPFRSCLDEICVANANDEDRINGDCYGAAAHYLSKQRNSDTEAYEQAAKDHFDAVVEYQNTCKLITSAKESDCEAKEAKIHKLSEKRDDLSPEEYNSALSDLSKKSSQAARDALSSTTGFFNVATLSVGNEYLLEVGGSANTKTNILSKIINVMARLFGTFAVLMFVIGAFFMITSQGDDTQLQKGKTIVLYTVLGLIIGFSAYMIVQFVINILFQT